jgi:hypothetical protein
VTDAERIAELERNIELENRLMADETEDKDEVWVDYHIDMSAPRPGEWRWGDNGVLQIRTDAIREPWLNPKPRE